jgi:hypothetical protein
VTAPTMPMLYTVFLPNFKVVRTCPYQKWKKFGHAFVTSAITRQSTNLMIAPIDQISS